MSNDSKFKDKDFDLYEFLKFVEKQDNILCEIK
jgi:hypothetical protein